MLETDPLWKGLLKVVDKLHSNFRRKIGNGNTIIFCLDSSLKNPGLYAEMQFVDKRDRDITLSQVSMENGEWDFSIL